MSTEVKCPQCQAAVVWGPQSPYRPFCSKRCQLMDLGEWADERNAIVSQENPLNSLQGLDPEDAEAWLAEQQKSTD